MMIIGARKTIKNQFSLAAKAAFTAWS